MVLLLHSEAAKNKERLEFNDAHHIMIYAHCVNLLGEMSVINKS
jgi:hypothetical protein